jgi:thiol-disulfide isomerase/thioredoxin
MKFSLFLVFNLCLVSDVFCQVSFPNLTVSPARPQAGKSIEFSFNASETSLANANEVSCVAYFVDEQATKAQDVSLKKVNKSYTGQFAIPNSAKAVFISFQNAYIGKWENRQYEGFPVMLYDKKEQIKEGGYANLAKISTEWATQHLKNINKRILLDWYKKEFEKYPQNKRKFLDQYLDISRDTDLENSKFVIAEELQALAKAKDLGESDLILLHKWYEIIGQEAQKDHYASVLKMQFPTGNFVMDSKYLHFVQEFDYKPKKILYEHFRRDFPKASQLKVMRLNLAYQAAQAGDWVEFEEILMPLKLKDKAVLYNSLAFEWAEQNVNLEKARELSAQTTAYAKSQMLSQSKEEKPAYSSLNQWNIYLKERYATYADTYGFILYKLKNYDAAVPYLKEAAEIFVSNREINARYTNALEKSSLAFSLKTELEKFVRAGFASEGMKAQLKSIYEISQNHTQDFNTYLADLEQELHRLMRASLSKKLMSERAPSVDWVDLTGKKVTLADFKNKIIVLNFWATWCENCIASFPFLEKLTRKYAENQDIVFLFVNTWENVNDKRKSVEDFIMGSPYKFRILLDNHDQVIDDFNTNSIFSKIIIDKSGNIRFKNIEMSDNYERMTDELSMMIEMVKE